MTRAVLPLAAPLLLLTPGCTDPNCLRILTESLPPGRSGIPYSFQLEAECSNGQWEHVSGALPPGLALGSDGRLEGTPTRGGGFEFTVVVGSDSGGHGDETRTFTLTIVPVGTLEVAVQTLGGPADPDGYMLEIERVSYPVGANEIVRISGVSVGNVVVTLTGVDPPCAVQTAASQFVVVSENEVATLHFLVSCS